MNNKLATYVNHPIGVSFILKDEAKVSDIKVLVAAILHDTLEDTDTTAQEIESHFGPEILKIVLEVTDDKTLDKETRKRLQIEHARHTSDSGKLVKMADKLHNLRDLKQAPPKGWDLARLQQYFRWARMVVEGCKGVNTYLDDQLDLITDPQKSFITFQGKEYPCFDPQLTPTYTQN